MASEPRKGPHPAYGQAGLTHDLISIQTDILGEAYSIQMDMYETSDEVVIEMDMPGMGAQEITVTTQDDWLAVEGVKRDAAEEAKVNYLCMERVFGPVKRVVQLPSTIDLAKARACYKNGVLTIRAVRMADRRSKTRRIVIEGE
ncbi:MAG: Hsp20/alpha crystallin family protein [Nitrospinae bacterium]|nr:Hsp20/alpha crystallin family protein [Nitrospinota bacterium]MBF0634901.1 Hsp20/alpha crystallin family protein [Nitrospinota bacterium]